MTGVSLDDEIDAVYREPPRNFVAARNALAKTLSGADAARVRKLERPTVPAWAVNQLYWRDRKAFDRLVQAGAALRNAQIAQLKGRTSDVRGAAASHRAALADAVQRVVAAARGEGVHVDADAITKTLEALSLGTANVTPGRLTRPLQPAGFEALAGVKVAARAPGGAGKKSAVAPTPDIEPRLIEREHADTARVDKRAEAARRAAEERQAALRRAAERDLERARREEARARHELAAAQKKLADAELRLRSL